MDKPIPIFHPNTPAAISRRRADKTASRIFSIVTLIPVALIFVITIALIVRFMPILQEHSLWELITGMTWKPMKGEFGFAPFIVGTFWVTILGVGLAVPPCILTALYLAEYAHANTRTFMKPLLDLLAAIPSVVYGVWGVLAIVPFVGDVLKPAVDQYIGFMPLFADTQPTGYGILSGSIVLAVMIAPFIIAIIYEVLMTVPQGLRQASLGIGATRWQTIHYVVLPQILPAIVAGIVLGASRALGETMAVLMVVGNVAKMPSSIFDPAYPLPALIANNYGEMMSVPLYDAALLGAALILLVIILFFNIASMLVLRRILEKRSA